MLERDHYDALPPYSHLVRRHGRAVAAYRSRQDAEVHVMPLEDARVDTDRCTGMVIPQHHRLWRVDAAVRAGDAAIVDDLAARWLAGCNR